MVPQEYLFFTPTLHTSHPLIPSHPHPHTHQAVTDWLEPPAVSRNGNKECIILGFYDDHDLWHFLSALGLFFSFLLLLSLDDTQKRMPHSELRVF